MKIIKVPLRQTNLASRIVGLRTRSREILNKFCIDKVRESKLSTSSFSYDFDLAGRTSLATKKKSVQRLFELLYKSVKKQIPYVEYIKGGEMFNTTRITGEYAKIKLTSPYLAVIFDEQHNDIHDEIVNLKWLKSKHRYMRYLNQKSIEFGAPLFVGFTYEHEVHPDDTNLCHEICEGRNIGGLIRVKLNITLTVRVGVWNDPAYEEFLESDRGYGIKTHDEYVSIMRENSETSYYAYDPAQWTFTLARNARYVRGAEKYLCMEKLFVMLDQMQKVLKTFSRITTYDTAAFTIGGEQSS
jgi:hypothetical protein